MADDNDNNGTFNMWLIDTDPRYEDLFDTFDAVRPVGRQDRRVAAAIYENLVHPKRNELWDDPNPLFNYYRAGGDNICAWCGFYYIDHPVKRVFCTTTESMHECDHSLELHVLCNTDRVKL